MELPSPGTKHFDVLARLIGGYSFISLLTGSVRSGKTVVTIQAFIALAKVAQGRPIVMVGRTQDTLKRNILAPMMELLGSDVFSYSLASREARLYGNKIHLVGASNELAEDKIRGMTVWLAYCDEVTLFPKSFFDMLVTRLSVDDARLIGTTNPDLPKHWLKKEYIDQANKKGVAVYNFTLDDNKWLSKEYIMRMKLMYTGLFYSRFILGLWVAGHGSIYQNFTDDHIIDLGTSFDRYIVAIDYGIKNPCVFLLIGVTGDHYHVIYEYYWDSVKESKQKTDSQYLADYNEFADGFDVEHIYIDPSAASLSLEFENDGLNVIDADNAVIDGIAFTSNMFNAGTLTISPNCPNTIEEHQGYIWDDKAAARGKEQPVKTADHAPDALRYGVFSDRNSGIQFG